MTGSFSRVPAWPMVQVRCLVESDFPQQKYPKISIGHFGDVGGQFVFFSEEQDFQHQHLASIDAIYLWLRGGRRVV